MRPTLERGGDGRVLPLVRPTHSQAEIDLLPPYGDPEVNLVGEVGTYFLLGAVATALVRRLID